MCQPGPFASAADALAAVPAGLSHLAGLDMTTLTTAEQAECLRGLGRADAQRRRLPPGLRCWARSTAAAASRLTPPEARDRGCAGRPRSPRRRPLASSAGCAASPRTQSSPQRWPRAASRRRGPGRICDWTGQLPESRQPDGDGIPLSAAAGGAELADLAGLAEEMHRRYAQPDGDGDDDGFRCRSLRLTSYFRGEGQLTGNLTPECTAAVRAVLDALGAKAGREDTRTQAERDHDALAGAMRRLVAVGSLPDRAASRRSSSCT